MRKLLITLHIVLLLACYNSHSQEHADFFRRIIDSLDHIHPQDISMPSKQGLVYQIDVRNQREFDYLNVRIKNAICEGEKNILVIFGKGVFMFKENQIELLNYRLKDVSLSFKGNGTVLTSDSSYTSEGYCESPWLKMETADDTISIFDLEQKICFLPYCNKFKEENGYKRIQITQWFRAPIYDVFKIDEKGIYFVNPDIEYTELCGRKGYNMNYDFLYSGKKPRFRLYDKNKEKFCIASCFLSLIKCSFHSLSLQGICFYGNKQGRPLISLNEISAEHILVENCKFQAIRGMVLSAEKTNNLVFNNNSVTRTIGNELSFSSGCKNIRVTRNSFNKCGQGLNNTICVRCSESKYYIAGNSFVDFGYCAVGVGLWYNHKKKEDTKGIIEYNEICYSPNYLANKERYTLMDAGAVYVFTQNDEAIIRYNYIHDYGGMRFNSGIYCDDGASNCKIYGNVILNTPDGCSITSRRVEEQKEGFRNNSNNFIADNLLDGAVVFESSSTEDSHCQKGTNYHVAHRNLSTYKDCFSNLERKDDDVVITNNVMIKKRIKKCLYFK